MLYNKNNVRKTNDKKILHKVGKQWKVVSVALLMAIGGGAAVATHANAQQTANNNYSSNAEAQEIAGNDSIGNNAVTPKSTSSASAKPAKPASAVSYLSGYNGSAASYHAKAQTDEASYQANSAIVKTYVNSLNNEFPKQTTSLTSALNSATDQTNADQSSENSYSAIAAQSNYSSQVSSLAAKANMTSSAYIESVGAQASSYNSEISANSVLASQMSTVNSYAQLISNISANPALSQEYSLKAVSAEDAASVANAYRVNSESVLNNALNLSASNTSALINNQSALAKDNTEEQIALANAGADKGYVQSIANANSNVNYANSSSVSNVISAIASATNNTSNGAFGLFSDGSTVLNNSSSADIKAFYASHDVYGSSSVKGQTGSTAYNYYYVSPMTQAAGISNVSSNDDGILFAATAKSGNIITGADVEGLYDEPAFVQDISDTAAQLRYSAENVSLKAAISNESANVSRYSDQVASASAAAQSAQNSYDNASDEASAMAELANYPTLANIFANPSSVASGSGSYNTDDFAKQIAGSLNGILPGQALSMATQYGVQNLIPSSASALNSLEGDLYAGFASAAGKFGSSNAAGMKEYLQTRVPAHASELLQDLNDYAAANKDATLASAVSAVSNEQGNGEIADPFALSAVANDLGNYGSMKASLAVKIIDRAAPVVVSDVTSLAAKQSLTYSNSSEVTTPGILSFNSYSAAFNAVNQGSELASDNANLSSKVSYIGSVANNANSNYTSASSASVSYSAATHESVALASSYATSYSADVNSDENVQSAAKNSLDNFYATHADTKYATASSNAASLSAAVPSDNAYAEGNGLHVFNYGPKFIIVTKAGQLHTKPDYNTKDDKVVGKVPAGAQLAVKSVYFGQNGITRYEVTYDGTTGLFTANPAFSKQAYLPAYSGVDVTVNKNARVYKSADFKKAIGSIKAGKTMKDVNVVTMDHKRNGFTRVETQDGKWFTANTNYVSLDGTSANNTNSAEAQQLNKSNNPVNFWN